MSVFRFGCVGAVALTASVLLAGCVPEAAVEGTPSPSRSSAAVSPSPMPTSSQTSSATPSPTPTTGATLPASCDDVYADDMRAELEGSVAPLNDPGISLLSTAQAPLLELLEVVPTLRCTWGAPGGPGIATNVSIVDAAQSADVRSVLSAAGFGCEDVGDAVVCRIEQRGVTLDDTPYVRGETHGLSGSVWVTTAWLDIDPDGYTQSILSTLGG